MYNFNLPYFSSNPREFWHRWHISLSTWLRDYLYISLGGNRGGRFRTNLNLSMATMILGGLMARSGNYTYIIWGTYHGLLLICYPPGMIRDIIPKGPPQGRDRYSSQAVVENHPAFSCG